MKYTRKPVSAELIGNTYQIRDGMGKEWTMPKESFEALYESEKISELKNENEKRRKR